MVILKRNKLPERKTVNVTNNQIRQIKARLDLTRKDNSKALSHKASKSRVHKLQQNLKILSSLHSSSSSNQDREIKKIRSKKIRLKN